jgi:FixJ family two-component response regulator
MNMRPLVSVIDDDESVRESLPHLLKGFGFAVRAFFFSRRVFGFGSDFAKQVLDSRYHYDRDVRA